QFSIALGGVEQFDRAAVRRFRNPSATAIRDAVETFGRGEPWLLFIDQFEQVFLHPNEGVKKQFLAAITDLAEARSRGERSCQQVCLVLALRDDFWLNLGAYPELCKFTDKHCYRLFELSRGDLEEVIIHPASTHQVWFEPGLVEEILEEVERQP